MFARGALQFDLSDIPSDAEIIEAEFSIFFLQGSYGLGVCSLFAITEDWNVSEATWYDRMTGFGWSTEGGSYNYENMVATASMEVSGWETYDVTAMINSFVRDHGSNFGFFIYPASDDRAYSVPLRAYVSSDADAVVTRPKITINYDVNSSESKKNSALRGCKVLVESLDNKFVVSSGQFLFHTVTIADSRGRLIYRNVGNNVKEMVIPKSSFANGLYLLTVLGDKNIIQKKVILQ